MTPTQHRVSAGVPTGGQFASQHRSDADITLDAPAAGQLGSYSTQTRTDWGGSYDVEVNDETGLTDEQFDRIVDSYIDAALWSTSDGGEAEFLDGLYDRGDVAPESLRKIRVEAQTFLTQNRELVQRALAEEKYAATDGTGTEGQFGHDLLLSRNGHGTGFFDAELPSDLRARLQDAARGLGESEFYAGDDRRIHV